MLAASNPWAVTKRLHRSNMAKFHGISGPIEQNCQAHRYCNLALVNTTRDACRESLLAWCCATAGLDPGAVAYDSLDVGRVLLQVDALLDNQCALAEYISQRNIRLLSRLPGGTIRQVGPLRLHPLLTTDTDTRDGEFGIPYASILII